MEFLKSDINFILGKIAHVQQKYEEALKCYTQSTKLNSQNFAAQFNLAKIYISFKNNSQAETCLELVLSNSKFKDCYEALRLLAQTKSRLGKTQESVSIFKRVLELNPKDFEANFEIAQMFETTEPKYSLVYYESGLKIMQQEI